MTEEGNTSNQSPVISEQSAPPPTPPPNPGEVVPAPKSLDVTSVNNAQSKVSDIAVVGNGDTFRLLCKASSKKQGWMKSSKAMEIPGVGCVVQTTTQQINPDGSSSLADAICFVPSVKIADDANGGRKLVHIHG